jgi:hypothetical protein
MRSAQTLFAALGAALLVLAGTADLPQAQTNQAQTNGDAGVLPPAARRDSNRIPEKIRPESGSSTEPLSNQLDRSGGVIHPPDVDPGIAQSPPKIGSQSTPVIPPPGSSGDSPLKPK